MTSEQVKIEAIRGLCFAAEPFLGGVRAVRVDDIVDILNQQEPDPDKDE